MDQLGFLPSSQLASHHGPCRAAALNAPYSDFDNAYANWSLHLWLESVSIPPGGIICESPDLYPPPVAPSHLVCLSTNATAATNPSPASTGLPCQSTSPRLASRSIDLETGSDAAPEPASYAKLIYSTLLSAPEHKLRLQGIYWWFMENTTKPKDVNSTSWKSSELTADLKLHRVLGWFENN
ncbi:hypothetical protein BJX66DRAFT_188515 [Aspergillus keveii]|uniref:Fork-head domain-containing protein n=1 Tax=Aspergillus keveii TaxID=714993 RepID=A0ABR4G7B3_9EURO